MWRVLSLSSRGLRRYPSSHGATAVTFSNALHSEGGAPRLSRPKWLLIGQEGGAVVRGQTSRILGGAALTQVSSILRCFNPAHQSQESFKSLPPVEEVFPPLRKDTFGHEPHIGGVCSMDSSPFHRSLFLSGGGDGLVKLSHLLERDPLRVWEPLSGPGSASSSPVPPFISCVKFSPIRPAVFAAASSDGLLYLYDLHVSADLPVATLEAAPIVSPSTAANGEAAGAGQPKKSSGGRQRAAAEGGPSRAGLTGLAFNPKQRDLVAVCDWLGRVHIWKLGWALANRRKDELALLTALGSIGTDATEDET